MSRTSAHPHRATLPHPGSPVAVLPRLRALANLRCDADTLGTASNLQTRADGTSTRGGGGRGAPECKPIIACNSAGVLSARHTSQAKLRLPATSGTPGRVHGRSAATRIPISREGCPGRPNTKGVPQHGTESAYDNFGCRCSDAIKVKRTLRKRRKAGINPSSYVPHIGAMRRVRALACLGYSPAMIAQDVCVGYQIQTIRQGTKLKKGISRKIDAHIREFYREHCDRPLPPTSQVRLVRNLAKRNGWAPPIAWDNIDDPGAVPELDAVSDTGESSVNEESVDLDLLLSGRSTLNTSSPRRQPPAIEARRTSLNRRAVQILSERGYTTAEISRRIGLVERQVQRHLAWILNNQSELAETTLSATDEDEAPAA